MFKWCLMSLCVVPQLYLWGLPFWGEMFAYVTVFFFFFFFFLNC